MQKIVKIIIVSHILAAAALAVLAAFDPDNSTLMHSALLGGINLICSLTVCFAVRAASGDSRYNMLKLCSIERIVSIECLLFTLPLFIIAAPFSEDIPTDIIFIADTILTFIVLFVSILIADSKYR